MKIVVDENIAFAAEAFQKLGSIQTVNGRDINNKILKDADALIVRSITDVNKSLLEKTNVEFVGTATIGTDHIDIDYLKRNRITFADAKGCNADSVAEYVFTALLKIAAEEKIKLSGKIIGVVGVGNIGSRVVRLAENFGMKVLKNDPPKERAGIGSEYVTLNEVLKADIITLHVPLNKTGIDKTLHLLNEEILNKLKAGMILINTSRGEIIDSQALLNETKAKNLKLILDVWENEPDIITALLKETQIGTAHIAGYTLEGKVRGTKMIYDVLCNYLNKDSSWRPSLPKMDNGELSIPGGNTIEEKLYKLFSSIYNIEKDNSELRKILKLKREIRRDFFDTLRKEYPVRREFSNYRIALQTEELNLKLILEEFKFKMKY